jgi:hypothetical protein
MGTNELQIQMLPEDETVTWMLNTQIMWKRDQMWRANALTALEGETE